MAGDDEAEHPMDPWDEEEELVGSRSGAKLGGDSVCSMGNSESNLDGWIKSMKISGRQSPDRSGVGRQRIGQPFPWSGRDGDLGQSSVVNRFGQLMEEKEGKALGVVGPFEPGLARRPLQCK